MECAQHLLPLLEDTPPRLTALHTIHLCRHVDYLFNALSRSEQSASDFRESSPDKPRILERSLIDYYEVNLRFYAEFLTKVPDIFSVESRECFHKDFTQWLIAKILQMLALEEARCLEKACVGCCLNFIKSLSLNNRRDIIVSLIRQLQELCALNEHFDSDNSANVRLFSASLDEFSLDSVEDGGKKFEVLISPPEIFIDLIECERLQSTLCSLLLSCVEASVYQVPTSDDWIAWDCVIRQLQYADWELKDRSINLCIALFDASQVVLGALKYCTDCVLALVELLCQECSVLKALPNAMPPSLVGAVHKYISIINERFECNDLRKTPFCDQPAELSAQFLFRCLELSAEIVSTKETSSLSDISLSLIRLAEILAKAIRKRFEANFFDQSSKFPVRLIIAQILKWILDLGDVQSIVLGEGSAGMTAELLWLFYCLDDADSHVGAAFRPPDILTSIREYVFTNAEKLGDVKEVLSIVRKFMVCSGSIYQLIVDGPTSFRLRLSLTMNQILNKFVCDNCPSLLNALSYCCKLMDRALVDTVYGLVTRICYYCIDFLAHAAVDQNAGRSLCIFISLASLRWIKSKDLKDLVFDGSNQYRKLSQCIVGHLDDGPNVDELRCLSVLNQNVCPEWRRYVFSSLLASSNASALCLGLDYFPDFFHTCNAVALPLLNDLVLPISQCKNVDEAVLISLCKTVGSCTCIMANSADKRSTFNFSCRICNQIDETSDAGALDAARFTVLCSIFNRPDFGSLGVAVKENLCKCVCSIATHCYTSDHLSKIVTASLILATDSSLIVRNAFIRCWKPFLRLQKTLEDDFTKVLVDWQNGGMLADGCNESLIRYFGQIACYGSGNFYESAAIRLMNYATDATLNANLCQLAVDELRATARRRNLAYKELYVELAFDFTRLLVRHLVQGLKNAADSLNGQTVNVASDAVQPMDLSSSSSTTVTPMDESLKSLLELKINRLCTTFDFVKNEECTPDWKYWCRLTEKYVVTNLIMFHCVEASRVHKAFASLLKTNRNALICRNISHIVAKLTLSGVGNDENREIIKFVEKEASKSGQDKLSFASLLSVDIFNCTAELVCNLGSDIVDENRVFNALYKVLEIFSCPDEDFVTTEPNSSELLVQEIREELNKRFFGILIRFEEKLRFTNPLRDKLCVMRSFARFMKICDSKILGDAKLKALSILKFATALKPIALGVGIEDCSYERASDTAWLALVQSLPLDDLKRACLHILLALSERVLDSDAPKQENISETAVTRDSPLAYLLVNKWKELSEQFDDFAFLLDCPPLSIVQQRLPLDLSTRIASLRPQNSQTQDIKLELSQAVKIACDESTEVKRYSLRRLAFLLRQRQLDVYRRLICEADSVDAKVLQAIDLVLLSLNHSDRQVRYWSAVCFGELGAVDPGRLRSSNCDFSPGDKIVCSMKSADDFVVVDLDDQLANVKFAIRLLRELHKHLVGSTIGEAYNVLSYTVQEMLKFFACVPSSTATSQKSLSLKHTSAASSASSKKTPSEASVGERIWLALPNDVRTTLMPFINTRYVVSKNSDHSVEITYPLVANKDVDFRQWLQKLLFDLISKIKHIRGLALFEPLSMAAATNVNFARFLLPHVVLQKLKEGEDSFMQTVLDEFKLVLSCDRSSLDTIVNNRFVSQAAQEIFLLLDFLGAWVLKDRAITEKQIERRRVENFIRSIPQMMIVDCATLCQSYTRALMSYEIHISEVKASPKSNESSTSVQPFLSKLQELYSHLGDVDSVVGALDVRKSKMQPSPKEEIIALECIGNYTEALPFHELLTTSEPEKVENHTALIKCLLRLNQSNLALGYIDGLMVKNPKFENAIHPYKIEALCKLENWDTLEEELKKNESVKTWGSDIADVLLTIKKGKVEQFSEKVQFLRNDVLSRLHAVALDSTCCDRTYKHLLRLHIISEIENGAASFIGFESPDLGTQKSDNLVDAWDCRFEALQASADVLNNVLDMRRKILSLASVNNKNGGLVMESAKKSWLQSLRIARKSGHLQSALSLLAKVKALGLPEAFEEEAKLLWLKNEQDAATNCLSRGINEYYGEFLLDDESKKSTASAGKRIAFAQAQLRMANYARESSSCEFNEITRMYKLILSACPEFEDAHYYLAMHFDLAESKRANFKNQEWIAQRQKILMSYGTGLQYGSKFVHHAMPRMLTLWLDAASKLNAEKSGVTPSLRSKSAGRPGSSSNADQLKAFNALMATFGQSLPVYQFYSSFSQLTSRIAHPCHETVQVLKQIIARTILAYPQQCLWMSIPVSRSSVSRRREIFNEIFKIVGKEQSSVLTLIKDLQKLRDLLQTLCFHKEASFRATSMNMSEKFPELFRLFTDGAFSRIMLPIQSLMDVTLPVPVSAESPDNFNPFPNQCVYIESFENFIEIFPTLQRPKKVSMRGSDGRSYSVLCKPKDDLRIDKRVMEFASLVNVFLLRYPETRRRQLKIRTYAVVPLSEDFGLMEWVPGLQALRTVLLSIYKESQAGLPNDKLKELCAKTKPDAEKLKIFTDQLLPRYPSVLSVWLRRCFAEPTSWYHARTNFTRSLAVMSVVGFVLGLGDRHGENILLDTCAGHVMHVDFNCLFDRGLELDVPELVPFRLTHNIVDAMGPLGYEGPFRKTCEATMRVLRNEKQTLSTVLATFLYDPLVEWRKHDERIKLQQQQQQALMQLQQPNASNQHQVHSHDTNRDFTDECVSDKAQQYLKNIDSRLNGCVSLKPGVYGSSLSVEAQISHLIRQATDPKLLSKMYVGWAAYM